MRPLGTILLLGSLGLAVVASAQTLTEHAAAAAGATVGTAAGKPISNALVNVFGQVDHVTATAGGGKAKPKSTTRTDLGSGLGIAPNPGGGTTSEGFGPGASPDPSPAAPAPVRRAKTHPAPVLAVRVVPVAVEPPAPPPPVKEPTLEELASIKIGSSAQEVQAVLGTPASHISVPADGGHLLESCQYWAQGQQLGTVRMDNGQVVKVELRSQD